ncbi:MAG: tetratricopeptide repeat protein [Rivularia sp. (in: cyanobacteria)]
MNTQKFSSPTSESNLKDFIQNAVQKHQSGELDEAKFLYKNLLKIQPNFIDVRDSWSNEYYAIVFTNLGTLSEQEGDLEAAIAYYKKALELKPDYGEVYYNLGNVFLRQSKLEIAIESYQQALKIKPEYPQAHNNLGNIFQLQGKLESAIESYQEALKSQPKNYQIYYNLGNVFLLQGKLETAKEFYQKSLKIQPAYAEAYEKLAHIFRRQNNLEAAIESYQEALKIQPESTVAYVNLGNILCDGGDLEAAIEKYKQALKINPSFAPAKFGILISQIPIIYSNVAEINLTRSNYQQHLNELAENYRKENPDKLKEAVNGVGVTQPFYLAYQGLNDRELQRTYGEMLVQIMSNCYPQWSKALASPDLKPNEKIRIGFVSKYFYNHSNWKIPIKGWIENLNRSEFELFAYHTDSVGDRNTIRAAKEFDKFIQGPLHLEKWCELIQKDKLHILIFPEFGMDSMTLKLGCLRLAPIQMTSWGHPQTSGLPTIDYYLSSDLMEPENAQENYTEKLVRLPNLSIFYSPLAVEIEATSKKEIGISDDEIMFWCCQSLYKYLPQHDDVFPRIAKELTNAKFVFIQYHQGEYVTEVFRRRLRSAFEEFGLNYQDYCLFLPRMNGKKFAGTAAIADVFLDSIDWSGCNSTLESIAHNVPAITFPGELMRGRHSLAILTMMGIEETIASSKQEYVQIAIRLGRDFEYRQHISQLVAGNKHKLYGDLKTVKTLENFFFEVVNKPREFAARKVADTLRLAMEHHRSNRLAVAQKAYHQVLALQPNHPEALYGLGVLAQQMGQFQEAEKLLSVSTQVEPNSVKAWFSLGNLHQTQGKLAAAELAYQRAISIRPDAGTIHNNLGYTLQQQGKWEAAIASYQKALEVQPNCVEADVNLGNALHSQSKLSAERQVNYGLLNYKLGYARKQAGDLKTAVTYYRQAIILFEAGESAIALQPKLLGALEEVNYNLGLVLQAQDEIPEAIACYQKVLQLNPQHSQAKVKLEQINQN